MKTFAFVSSLTRVLAVACIATLITTAPAQNKVNKANWKAANRFTAESLRPYMYSMSLSPGWINKTSSFWYLWRDSNGPKFWRVDPVKKKKEPLFDTDHMAMLLSEATKRPYDRTNFPISTVTFDEKNDKLIRFVVEGTRYEYDTLKDTLKSLGRATPQQGQAAQGQGQGQGGRPGGTQAANYKNESPDKKSYIYAQDYNLYYVELVKEKDESGKEVEKELPPVQLTTDGAKDYSFGSRQEQDEMRERMRIMGQVQQQQEDQQGETVSVTQATPPTRDPRVRPNGTWSKDSKRWFVTRTDMRKVKDLFLVNSLVEPRPGLLTYKYSMPGETDVPQQELFAFERETKTLKKLPVEKYRDQLLLNIHWQEKKPDVLRLVRRDRL
ncbi:MAG TPA: hypothetical protein VEX38_00875, partial [Fimbriimonadaceae bacterium]|nr:hypothetical protein [Fimbriimonadaceae bacterium]